MQIRSLQNADMFRVVGMLKKIAETASGDKLARLFSSAVGGKKSGSVDDMSVQLGFLVMTELYNNLLGDLQEWLASLCDKSLDEFMAMPPETTIDVIEQLVEGEESKRFFSRACQLYKKMNGLVNRIPKK